MKATIVLIADVEAENYGRKLMLEAHRLGETGFEMARLPQHISLKQPFSIPSLEEIEAFFDEFAKELHPVTATFEQLDIHPSDVIGGIPSGCMSLRVEKSGDLEHMQQILFEKLESRFGPCPAAYDNDYIFHMTIAIGKAPFANYQRAYEQMAKELKRQSYRFSRLGLLYYDDDALQPGTYFCYKIASL